MSAKPRKPNPGSGLPGLWGYTAPRMRKKQSFIFIYRERGESPEAPEAPFALKTTKTQPFGGVGVLS